MRDKAVQEKDDNSCSFDVEFIRVGVVPRSFTASILDSLFQQQLLIIPSPPWQIIFIIGTKPS